MEHFFEAPKPKLIYAFRIDDEAHRGCLKIGETTFDVAEDDNPLGLQANDDLLNRAARRRIDQYTATAGIAYTLLYTETTLHMRGTKLRWFNDKDVHDVLLRSGIKRKAFEAVSGGGREWFETDLETVKRAITAVKEGRRALTNTEVTRGLSPVSFRPEQRRAIDMTLRRFARHHIMLWNAKMRFGKTLSALQVVREASFGRTLIYTHRPDVIEGWHEDFQKIFYDRDDYAFGSKNGHGQDLATLERLRQKTGLNYIFFASLQDLRGSKVVGGEYDKNDELFSTPWDLLIIDEAHEGTQTALGRAVLHELAKSAPKRLELTGTAFNLLEGFDEAEVYTWDYTMEQRAKAAWDRDHLGDPSPYAGLPRMHIYTYDLGRLIGDFADEEVAFNFREFFRCAPEGDRLIHEGDVKSLLDLLSREDAESMYPFANGRYRAIFRHTLWMVPGVKAASALSRLLRAHPVFGMYEIVNVAGDGDEEEEREKALKKVRRAIAEATYGTITLSCGRLTTGVSVPEWTGVLMLAGSYNTAASAYMQTIFRVQTPYTRDGLVKEDCYVFDFAPDRTLQVLATVPRVDTKAGRTTEAQKRSLGEFLNFCPVIAIEGSKMKPYDAKRMMEQLKRAYVERVVRNGFEDSYLYSDELLRLDEVALNDFKDLKRIIGRTRAIGNAGHIDINSQGLTQEEYEEQERLERKRRAERTEEEVARLDELKKKKKIKEDAISILRGISIRMPLLLYGAEIEHEETELTIHNFTRLVDARSWEVFMPRGVTKRTFNKFLKYYDPDVFAAAGKRIRALARAADRLSIEERIERITSLFATFRNPDKETVLTPWRVVNLHLSHTLGGYTFYDEDFNEPLAEPRYVDRHRVTDEVFSPEACLLEINSKSGLYPLYLAYNLYRRALKEELRSPASLEEHLRLWDRVVSENVFILCMSPMARAVTRRTLLGFRPGRINAQYIEGLIPLAGTRPVALFIRLVKGHSFWKANQSESMKFNAVVGNPPYQEEGESTRKAPIYHLFYDLAFQLSNRVSLITPGRFLFKAGQTPKEWMDKILADPHFKVVEYFQKSTEVFPTVDIKGGVAITYRDKNRDFGAIGLFSTFPELRSILRKVKLQANFKEGAFAELVSSRGMYRFADCFFDDYPKAKAALGSGTGNMITSNSFGLYPNAFLEQSPLDSTEYIQLIGRSNNQRVYRWIQRKYILPNEYLDSYNVLVPEANGTGAIGEVLSTPIIGHPIIGHPIIGHTDTFLSVGTFDNEAEARNCLSYIRTKFARTMLGTLKATQHNPKDTWANVPLQDFTSRSDIDYSQDIADIDRQLYKKYGLTKEEIAFIEEKIRPM